MSDFFQDYEDFVSESTDSPKIFQRFISYVLVGAAIKDKVFIYQGHYLVRPNFYLLIVAESSFQRKSTSLSVAKNILFEMDRNLLLANEYSPEKLVDRLQQRPQSTMFFNEFAGFYNAMTKDYMSGMKEFLTDIYDCPPTYIRDTVSGGEKTIKDPALNIIAATTSDWLDTIKSRDVHGGFLPRWMIVPSVGKDKIMPFPPKANQEKKKEIIDKLKEFQLISGEAFLTEKSKKNYENWFKDYEERYKDKKEWSAFYTRLQTTCIKFSMVFEVALNKSVEISYVSMDRAIAVVEELTKSMTQFMEEEMPTSQSEEKVKRVMKHLNNHGKHTDWSYALHRSKLSAKEFREVIDTLEQQDKIRTEEQSGANGKSKKIIFRS